jgi:hypothetical protein
VSPKADANQLPECPHVDTYGVHFPRRMSEADAFEQPDASAISASFTPARLGRISRRNSSALSGLALSHSESACLRAAIGQLPTIHKQPPLRCNERDVRLPPEGIPSCVPLPLAAEGDWGSFGTVLYVSDSWRNDFGIALQALTGPANRARRSIASRCSLQVLLQGAHPGPGTLSGKALWGSR